jgi:superfamily I DNA/RNA helicase
MPHKLTEEQQLILDKALEPGDEIIKVQACAGASKSFTLEKVAQALNPDSGIYIAFNKSVADESQSKFPETVDCSTIHSLAYKHTVRKYGLSVGVFKPTDIRAKIQFQRKQLIHNIIEKFCNSKYTKIKDYIDSIGSDITEEEIVVAQSIMKDMKNGKRPITHGFYLKLFHILLASKVYQPKKVDFLALDEAGDVSGVSLEMFKLIPAKKKFLVGDQQQSIYSFMSTVNGFKELEDVGVTMTLSQSFRVDNHIARHIESFSRTYLDPKMNFKGMKYDPYNGVPSSVFYLARTNSSLVEKMIQLINENKSWGMNRPAKLIFELPILMLNLKKDMVVYNPEFKFIEKEVKYFFDNDEIRMKYKKPFAYIAQKHEDDISIKTAIGLIATHGAKSIYKAYNKAKEHEQYDDHKIVLSTIHSAKGGEADEVHLMDDCNDMLDNVFAELKDSNRTFDMATDNELESFRLYYVAASRARYRLWNAKHLIGFSNKEDTLIRVEREL